jgi:cation:H+ antiporter
VAAGCAPYALAASAAGIAAALCLLGGDVGRAFGATLVVAYLVAVVVVWWIERRPPAFGEAAELEEHDEGTRARDSRGAVLVVAGVVAMAAGGWLAVSGAERIVSSLRLSRSVVGSTFVALATTAELFALPIAAAWKSAAYRRGVEELALAGVLGSAVYNAAATLGVATLVHPIHATGLEWQTWLGAALPALLVGWRTCLRPGRPAGWGIARRRLRRLSGAHLPMTERPDHGRTPVGLV